MSINRYGFFLFILGLLAVVTAESWAAKPEPVCGDGKCRGEETVQTCPEDCAVSIYCGDGTCDPDETIDSCPEDCAAPPPGTCNNDGTCNEGEDCISCPNDCAGVTGGKPSGRYCCGADTCDVFLCGDGCGAPSVSYCGDGVTDPGEECDDGVETAICDADCTFRICGDAYRNVSSGEECDDGVETAECDSDCTLAQCGDGTLNNSAGEECDDGNIVPGDGCSDVCLNEPPPAPYCGDGVVNQDSEQCDDGNTNSGDGCDDSCQLEQISAAVPLNQFNIGDSIGEAEAADGTIGSINHQTVWSTGYDGGDGVYSLNEQFEVLNADEYEENNSVRDSLFNHARSGDEMINFLAQATAIADAAAASSQSVAGMITILLGNNDVCAPLDLSDNPLDPAKLMTPAADFEEYYRAGLTKLAESESTKYAHIHVSSIPAIYWLWEAKRSSFWCRVFVWPNVPCDNLLYDAADDCRDTNSRLNPDIIYYSDGDDSTPDDGPNCIRRKEFHAAIRDVYNPILRDVLQEYIDDGRLPNASYIDIFDVPFGSSDVNSGDCFHPSEDGHALLADEEWCRSVWGTCSP